jgi:hypothetical protein
VKSFALICVAAVAIGGCGSSTPRDSAKEFSGEKAKVAAPVEALETAARDRKPEPVCSQLLSDRLLAQLKEQGTNCRTAVEEAFEDADSLDLTVDEITITGDKAVAKITSGTGSDKKSDTLELARDGAVWKIDLLRT